MVLLSADLALEFGLPRLYRDPPLNVSWEGSGNVVALDVLRAVGKQPQAVEALFGELLLVRFAPPLVARAAPVDAS